LEEKQHKKMEDGKPEPLHIQDIDTPVHSSIAVHQVSRYNSPSFSPQVANEAERRPLTAASHRKIVLDTSGFTFPFVFG
jgi:hypothetical protein